MAVMVVDEVHPTAPCTRLMIDRIMLETTVTEALAGTVIIDEVTLATATSAGAAAEVVTPTGMAAAQPVNLAAELHGAKTQRALRNAHIVGTGSDKLFGEPHRDRRAVGDLTAKHTRGVMQDPVKLALRDRRAEHRRDPVNLGGRQPGPQLRDTVTNLGGVIDVGFGFAPSTQQAAAVPRAVDQLVHRAAARAFTDSRLPTLHRTGTADALLELAGVDFGIVAAALGTPRRSNTHGAELA
ncbi:hypothetical protein [Mycolicibacterium mageritense]|uniref:hypothetical protein n=1 Tax=Mycolicibacterium mageritense TaxID=53462 RepID=UPI0023F27965|nr:hypothetical protein [Mycolicibacterium mageritense]